MKVRILLITVVLLIGMSCTKNPLNLPTPASTDWNWAGNGVDSMFAYINGVLWQCGGGMEAYSEAGSLKIITGTDGNSITITTNDMPVGGIIDIHGSSSTNMASYVNTASDPYSSAFTAVGKIKILENDAAHIRGLFYFDCKSPLSGDYKKITKGYFNIKK